MRADRVLRSLARRYRIHLRVVPLQELRPAMQGPRYAGPVETQARVWVRPSWGRRLRYRRDHEQARLSPGLVRALRESLPASAIDTLLVFRHGGRARASDLTWRHVDAVRQPHAPVYVQVMSVRVCLQQQEICAIRSVKASMALVHS